MASLPASSLCSQGLDVSDTTCPTGPWYPTAEDTSSSYLQGEVTHTTEGFCSFSKGSPPPDSPKSKGCPAKGQLLQTPCVQTKRSWEAHPKGEGWGLAPQGLWGVLQMLECIAPCSPTLCVCGWGGPSEPCGHAGEVGKASCFCLGRDSETGRR